AHCGLLPSASLADTAFVVEAGSPPTRQHLLQRCLDLVRSHVLEVERARPVGHFDTGLPRLLVADCCPRSVESNTRVDLWVFVEQTKMGLGIALKSARYQFVHALGRGGNRPLKLASALVRRAKLTPACLWTSCITHGCISSIF